MHLEVWTLLTGIKAKHFDLGAQTENNEYFNTRGMGIFSKHLGAQPKN